MILSDLKLSGSSFCVYISQGERAPAVLRVIFSVIPMALILTLCVFNSFAQGEGSQSGDFDPSTIHAKSLEYFISGAGLSVRSESQSIGADNLPGAQGLAGQSQIVSDLKISETVSPAKFEQSNPSMDRIADGSIIVAWQDEREGAYKIFLQKLDANGAVVGANVLAAERTDGYNLIEPQIKATISNKFYLAYRDEAAGTIRCIRFKSDLTVDLTDFRLDEQSGAYSGPFSIDSRATGELLIAYESYNGGNNILIRRFAPAGTSISATITANSDGGSASHWNPSIAYGSAGEFAVVWEDYRSGNADTYFRLFDSSGSPVGAELNLVDDLSADSSARDSLQVAPSLVYSAISQFVVAWSDNRKGWNVYFQRYHKQIGLLNKNQKISSSASPQASFNVSLRVDNNDRVNAIYSSHALSDRTLLQRYSATLTPLGAPTELNSSAVSAIQLPALVSTIAGGFAGVWMSSQFGNADIVLMLADSSGARALVSEVTLNDDLAGAVSDQPALASAPGLVLVTAFRDKRNDAGDIYAQISSLAEVNSGPNRRVNTDPFGSLQTDPDVAADQLQILVVWVDERPVNGIFGARVFARRGSIQGEFTESEFQISGQSTDPKANPSVAISPDGSAMIAWIDMRFGSPQIIGRLIDKNGALNPVELTISTPGADKGNSSVRVEADQSNIFRIFWIDRAALGGPKIRSRAFTSAGGFVGDINFTSDQGLLEIEEFDVALDTSGNIFYLWRSNGEPGALFLSGRSFTGAVSFTTVDPLDNVNSNPTDPSVSVDNQGFILTAWIDSRAPERRLYQRLYRSTIIPVSSSQPVSLAAAPAMSEPTALALRGRSWFSWVDARSEGKNVYLTGYVHSQTDVNNPDGATLPGEFALSQNYPNPFNPSTKISFTTPITSEVSLVIYNLLGQEVRTLAERRFVSGSHTLVWDGKDNGGGKVSSGVYFYRLRAESFTQTRKMALLK